MKLKQVSARVFYLDSRINIGVIKNSSSEVLLVDTGLDDRTGEKILQTLEENHLKVKAILNTHSHADHFGGNSYIKEKTGAEVYAPEVEAGVINYPILEPLYLFSGAAPIEELKNKFLMAPSCIVDNIVKNKDTINFTDVDIEIISLPGHSPNQIGAAVDGMLFCADSLMAKEVFEENRIPFNMDIDKQRETLKYLKNSSFDVYIPAHADPQEDITELVDIYLSTLNKIEERMLGVLDNSCTTEEVLKKTSDKLGFTIKNVQQHYLIKSVVTAFLSSLYNRGRIKLELQENSLYWSK